MALALANFLGFETGGLEEAFATTGSPDATEATIVRSGARSLKCAGAATRATYRLSGVISSTKLGIMGFALYLTDVTPTNDIQIAVSNLTDSSAPYQLVIEATTGDLLLKDDDEIEVGSATAPFTANTWHYVELFIGAGPTQPAEVFVDGTSVLGPLTSEDFGSASSLSLFLGGGTTVGEDVFFDDVYILNDGTDANDRLGGSSITEMPEVFKYQSLKSTNVPDDGGGNLDTGVWDDCGKTPLNSDNCVYTADDTGAVDCDAANGSPEGPANDARIDGDSNIKGAKAVCNMKRDGGGGTDHRILLGNDSDGTTPSADLEPTTGYVTKFFLIEGGFVPTSSQHFRIGFDRGQVDPGGQNFDCQEMWAMLLHVPTDPALTALSQSSFTLRSDYNGPFEI